MDSLITAAARALAAGDPLGALNRVALRGDAPALALRGIAMAQLGDLDRAKALLRSAARAFGAREAVARARCIVAVAEIALASRDLGWPARMLDAARTTLERHGDRGNAAHARHLEARRLLLTGHVDAAERALADVDPTSLRPASRAVHELVVAGIAIRRIRIKSARAALTRAAREARAAAIPPLMEEVERASLLLDMPAARLIASGGDRLLLLEDVEAMLASNALVVDACRNVVRHTGVVIPLATRPVLFAIARALAEAWPADVARDALVARAFGAKHADESHRARLRVEVARLRAVLRPLAEVRATTRGFALAPRAGCEVVVLARPVDEQHAGVLALLADGEWWSSSALALALGASQRTVQRALDSLAAAGKVQPFGRGRSRRWTTPPVPGFTTTLLLPASLPIDQAPCMRRSIAEIIREYGPFPGVDRVNGVTYDGEHVWMATGATLNAIDPVSGKSQRTIGAAAHAGTAFDGQHLFQLAEQEIRKIDPATGRVLATIPAPGGGGDSGLAWAEGTLWVGQYRDRKIHQVDPETGAILRTIESNRFVTGVTWVDGELWHGTLEGEESELRRVDPRTGEVVERVEMPPGVSVSGLESNGDDQFFCGGGKSGTVRVVRRPRRG
ncbi:MAG TPA: hypothetical protein VJU87_05615 [Gemmatimonadaceae bacterium]|nr:hypothetical protein [Gemmatimonadaceae bacterium]